MRHSRKLASAFFFKRTAAEGGLCLSHKARGAPSAWGDFEFTNSTLQSFRNRLILPKKRALLFQLLLQFFHRNVARNCIASQRKRCRGTRSFPHDKTGAADARGGLAVMGHLGAAPRDPQIVTAFGKEHPIRQFVKTARLRDRWTLEDDIARDMGFHRP